jgi:predicted house-cleaning noncanonical NTP pyrophosphatase (MazG superfamily)
MPTYNKLIRDKIPDIIRSEGKEFTTRTLSEEEYIHELRKKLQEELQEYLSTNNDEDALEELADLLELVYTLATVHGSTQEDLERIRRQKAAKRGGFQEKVLLMKVED